VAVTTTGRTRTGGALLSYLREPMRRASYALILGTGITSALGLLFWALAAHWLTPAEVGIGAALVSATTLLANVSTLGLRNGLVRFLPEAGAGARRLVAGAYAVCAAAAVAVAAVFVLGQPWWADELTLLRDSPLAAAAFCLGTAAWVLFILQDHVLTGLHRTGWVPVSNALASVAKIALLPVLAFSAGWAIFAASVLPAAVVVVLVTAIVLRRMPGETGTTSGVSMGRLFRFAATDHVAALLWLATANVLTLMVLQQLGPEASAYYFMANTIAYALFLVTSNISSALVAEGARFPDRAPALVRAALRNASLLVLPAAALGVLLAGPVLGLFGPDYVANARVLLQLLLLSAVPQLVIGVALAAARLRQDLRTVVLTYAGLAVITYGGSWLGLAVWGLAGVGIACLASQTAIAVLLLVTGRSGLGGPGVRRELGRRLGPALAACGLPGSTPARLLTSDSDALVVAADPPSGPTVLKIATSAAATAGLDRHADVLAAVGPELAGGPLDGLLPRVTGRATLDGERVLVETRLPGRVSQDPHVTPVALTAITALHRATAASVRVGPALLEAWVDQPLAALRRLPAWLATPGGLEALRAELHRALAERSVLASSTHGDFWSGNVLVADGEDGPVVRGIVDWEDGRLVGLPDADLVHWWLAAQPGSLGATVGRALADPAVVEADLAAAGTTRPNPDVSMRTVVLLAWLGHVAGGLTRAVRHPLSPVWAARNVRPVVRRYARSVGG
jgi:O-antigen/teichoic acid export membrane protein